MAAGAATGAPVVLLGDAVRFLGMAGHQGGAGPAQHPGASQDGHGVQRRQALQRETTAIATGKGRQRLAQRQPRQREHAQRQATRGQAIPRAQVQERPAHEAIAGAEQLQHADFLPPRLDVQAHGIADHQQRAEAQQRCQHQHEAPAKPQPCLQALAPERVVLDALGLPDAQINERSALSLLALLDLAPTIPWSQASNPLLGITPIMDWMRSKYKKSYKPNTRETVRRFTMHQFIAAGLAVYNPDDPTRAVNSPRVVYQISPKALALLRTFNTPGWNAALKNFKLAQPSLAAHYARERNLSLVPVTLGTGQEISLSPGAHNELVKSILDHFRRNWLPHGEAIYVGDTGEKWGHFDRQALTDLGVTLGDHGKIPDVVLYDRERNWLVLIESVTSHGPVNGKRHDELQELFRGATAGLVFVTAFPTRKLMARYLTVIAWETEVWCAEAPSHLIHFNGERFLGPYPATKQTHE